ncbi:DUF3667 domain-containing protein [Pontibacter liquoris]|uniref:DUF3667 domain-containing protein n=1 Tax=Pontibacter liquoris TaxID=2905677 RepID=UPI001FA7B2BB|nr:DUF3667 domain-containing protein [Pontibacter liquoris]
MEKKRRKYTQCPNCGYTFEEVNNYCPNCGQENHDLNVPVKHLLWEFLEGTIHFDTKVFRTLQYLITRPGYLTEKFNIGKRVSYVPPFRLYVFISFVFFFVLALDHDVINIGNNKDKKDVSAALAAPGVATTPQDSLAIATAIKDPRATFIKEKVEDFVNNGEKVREKMLKNISLMMFLLMPFVAYLLYLFYNKKRHNYVEHLMFSIHLHTFYFLLLTIVLLADMAFPTLDLAGWVFLIMIGYAFLALRRVYKQSNKRTLFKLIPLSFIYCITLAVFLIGAVIISAIMASH